MSLSFGFVVYTAVKPIFKIYLIIAVGITLARKNVLTVETSKNLSSLEINVLIPCLAFQKIVTNISNDDIHQISTIVIISFFMMGVGSLLCFGFGKLAGCPRSWYGGLICCGLLPNISDLPIAYLQTMEGSTIFNDIDKGVSYVIIYLTLQMLVQFNFGAFKLIEMDFHVNDDRSEGKNKDIEGSPVSETKEHDTEPDIEQKIEQEPENESIPVISVTPDHPDYSDVSLESSISATSTTRPIPKDLEPVQLLSPPTQKLTKPLSRTLSIPNAMLNSDEINLHPQGINDIIRVYSKYHLLEPINDVEKSTEEAKTRLDKIIESIKSIDFFKLVKLTLQLWVASTLKIISITLILSIAIAMIPWVQALFVVTPQAHLSPAPDGDPPLSFIMDFAGYIGAAEVPIGLLLLGGTIGRLNLFSIPLHVWKVPLAVVFVRLFLMPIIGCAFNSKLFKDGLFYNETILYFISNINFCLPPATSLLYITAFYTPVDNKRHLQMDYLALIYIFHYIFLAVCLPFTTTYTMKKPLHL